MSQKDQKEIIRAPSYYVKKRLLKNKPAMFGLVVIVIAHIIAIFGYLIMPDNTSNANDGAVQIQKKLPGFEVTLLNSRKNMEVLKVNFIKKMLFGQEREYYIVPISDYLIKNLTVYIQIYGRKNRYEDYDLVNLVKPLYVGHSDKIIPEFDMNYKVDGDVITYLDHNETIQTIKKADLVKEFKEKCIEQRKYILGTDRSGRDVLSRLIFGIRVSLAIGFIAVLISLAVGITLGALGGFLGDRVDKVILWLMTVVWSIPGIMLVIAISLALESKGIWVAFVAVGLTMWVDVARVVRGQILSVKEKTFVEAARALGFDTLRIIFIHILPNITGPIIVVATANFAAAILIEAGLSFLGLGVQPPTPSWGVMVNDGFKTIGSKDSWYLIVFPSACIMLMVFAFNLFGNGLRDAYDPKGSVK
ncbi:MAG: ABC transporter permease [Cytophagales bacterium]|nr:ABC transporter permease [Cytophagales bacterium]